VAVYGADCPRQTWTETSEHIRPRASLTEGARREACRRVGEDGDTVAARGQSIASQYGVGWETAMKAVRVFGEPLVDDPHRLDRVTVSVLTRQPFSRPLRTARPASSLASWT
jgi:hypothetical protein